MRNWHVVAVGSVALSLAACSAHLQNAGPPPRTANSIAQVGSVSVDVVSLTNWSQVENSFKPAYGLSGSTALANVEAINGSNVAANVNSVGFGLGAAVAGVTQNNQTTTATPQGGGTPQTTVNNLRQVKTPDVPQPVPTNSNSVTLVTAPTNLTGASAPSLPAMVTLVAADSYLRYAHVLEQGVSELAHKSDSTAFLAMFKISVIPNHRNEPYDLLLDLSVVPGIVSLDGPDPDNTSVNKDPQQPCDTSSQPPAETPPAQQAPAKQTPDKRNCSVLVLPFVVDALQNTEEDWTAQAVRSAALALSAQAGPVALNASFQSLQELLDHSQEIRPNSLLTVQKISGGNIRVRMGALRIGDNAYELQSMTHDIAVLLLVPNYYLKNTPSSAPKQAKSAPKQAKSENSKSSPAEAPAALEKNLTVLGTVRYIDARNDADQTEISLKKGKTGTDIDKSPTDDLSDDDKSRRTHDLQVIAKKYKPSVPTDKMDVVTECATNGTCEDFRLLTRFVNKSDYTKFRDELLSKTYRNVSLVQAQQNISRLWAILLDYAGSAGDPRFINQVFSIPGRPTDITCPDKQTAIAFKDGTLTQLDIDLAGGSNLAEKTVLSELHIGQDVFASESTNLYDTLDEQHFHYIAGIIDEAAISKRGTWLNLTISDPVDDSFTPCSKRYAIRAGKVTTGAAGAHVVKKSVKNAPAQKTPAKKSPAKAK